MLEYVIYMFSYVTKPESPRRERLTCVAEPIWTWMGSVVQTFSKPKQHAKLQSIVNLVFELRMSSLDGAVGTGGSTWPLPAKLGATVLAAATVARKLMLNLFASQSLK